MKPLTIAKIAISAIGFCLLVTGLVRDESLSPIVQAGAWLLMGAGGALAQPPGDDTISPRVPG